MQLLVEKYRPSTLDDYVWTDPHMRAKIESYITKGSIPELLFSGKPGTGKCLDYDEYITIKASIDVGVPLDTPYDIKIGDLFKALDLLDSTYEELVSVSGLEIATPTGFAPIQGLLRKRSPMVKVTLSTGVSFKCAEKHLVFEKGHCKPVNECDTIDTMDGSLPVRKVEKLKEGDVYDVSIPAPHVYVTPNGVKHHNTSLSLLLLREMGVHEGDILVITASRENGINAIKDKIISFTSTMPFGDFKYVIFDEIDSLSTEAQKFLRNTIENTSENVRFILTTNYPNKIESSIISRCQHFTFNVLDKESFTKRVFQVAMGEGTRLEQEKDLANVMEIIDLSYPDMRKCLNMLDQYTLEGVVAEPVANDADSSMDYLDKMVTLIKSGKILEARKLIASSVHENEYVAVYQWLYRNLDIWSKDTMVQNSALIIIRNAMVNHERIADPEINLSACLVELYNLM